MNPNLIVALIIQLCPNLEKTSNIFIIQGEKVTCMEYYTNDIINKPYKYEEMLKNVKEK